MPNTGGGGGGGARNVASGGAGGSGVVIVQYMTNLPNAACLTINTGGGVAILGSNIAIDGLNVTGPNLSLPALTVGNLTVNATSGDLTQAGPANVTGTSTIQATACVILNNATNQFNLISTNGTNIQIGGSGNIGLGTVTATSGDIMVESSQTTACISVSGPLSVTGANQISLTGRNIAVSGNITTVSGDINLNGNGGGSYQSGTFHGVSIVGPNVSVSSTSGNITVNGRGAAGSAGSGILVFNACVSTTGNGCLAFTGVSGNGSTSQIHGVEISNATISPSNGNTTINGTANANGSDAHGVDLRDGTLVTSTGSGNIVVNGNSTVGTNYSYGIVTTTTSITSTQSSIEFTGYANGSGTSPTGIYYSPNSNITVGNYGNVNMTGIAYNGTTNQYGININSSTTNLTASFGQINLTGINTNSSQPAILINSGSVRSSGSSITLNANSLTMGSGASVNATLSGEVVFQHAGTGNFTLNNITANTLALTSVNGTLNVNGVSSIANGVNLGATGNISLKTISANSGNILASTNQTTSCISVTGNIITSGSGSIDLTGRNIDINGNLTTELGNIILTGNGGGAYQTGSFYGVYVRAAKVISTSGGDVNINGRGGLTACSGVLNCGTIAVGGNGSLNITGVGSSGSGPSPYGIWLKSSSTSTANGNINLVGTAESTGSDRFGVLVESSNVTANGMGAIQITGTSGTGSLREYGIHLKTTAKISTANGPIVANGISRGSDSFSKGIYYADGGITGFIAGGSLGTISLTGTTANASAPGLDLNAGTVSTSGGQITLNANSINLATWATVNATTSGNVIIQSLGANVNLGGADDSANLGLVQAELSKITAGTLTIGSSTTGAILNTVAISRTSATLGTNLTLFSSGAITQAGGNLAVSGVANFVSVGVGDNGVITLNNTTNAFSGTIAANGTDLTIYNSNATSLGSIIATGNFTVNATSGNITQVAPASIAGNSSFTAAGNGISLNQTGNLGSVTTNGTLDFSNGNASSLNISDGTATISGSVNVSGLTTTSTNLTQTGGTLNALQVNGGVSTLSNGTVSGQANISAGTFISSVNIGSLIIGVSGTANISGGSVGAVTNSGILNSSGGAFASLDSSGSTSLTGGSVSGTTNITNGTFSTIPFVHLYGTINVSGGAATLSCWQAGPLNISAGSANVVTSILGSTTVSGTGALLVSGIGFLNDTLTVSGNGSANITTCATVSGLTTVQAGNLTTNGTLSGGLTTTGGWVNVYSTGTTTGMGNLLLGNVSTLSASGSNTTSFGRISADSITINNATLALSPSFTLANESAFTLIDNTGSSPISGTFNGLPEGAHFISGGNNLTISYQGGADHNNVVIYNTGGLSTVVNSNLDISNPSDNVVTLREALEYARLISANSGVNQTITFNLFGGTTANTITLSSGSEYGVISVNQNATLSIAGPLTASGNCLTISGGGVTGIFNLLTPTNLSNLTLQDGSAYRGGAIYNNANTGLTRVTIQQNTASDGGGAIWNDVTGQLIINESTIANNTALFLGGAIVNYVGSFTISGSTIAYNNSYEYGGLVSLSASDLSIVNSIVAFNTATTGAQDLGAAGFDVNYSLISNTTGAYIYGSNNLLDVNPLLGTLGFYGGNTRVFPLLPGSPAIDSGLGSNATDQRGITVSGPADMGSFQSRGFTITNTGGSGQTAMIGDTFPANLSLTVASAYSEPVNGGVVSFNAPAGNVPSAVVSGSTTISGGSVSVQATANAYYGTSANQTYAVTADASGANAAASYTLLNVGTPALLSITGGNNQTGPLSGVLGQNLAVNVKDSVGNNIPHLNVSFTPSTVTSGGTFGALGNIGGAGAGAVYTGQTDAGGNVTANFAGNGIGGLFQVQANATVSDITGVRTGTTQLANFTESTVGLSVQNGTAGRSFVNGVKALLGNNTLAANLVSSGNVRIMYLGMNGNSTSATPGNATFGSNGTSNITFNYGQTGIGGDNNSQSGDGIYQLEVDYSGNHFANSSLVTKAKFHRLFGDTNGDGVVDTTDYNVVIVPTVFGKNNVFTGANTNGVGQVYTKDVTTVLRQRGRRVAAYNVY